MPKNINNLLRLISGAGAAGERSINPSDQIARNVGADPAEVLTPAFNPNEPYPYRNQQSQTADNGYGDMLRQRIRDLIAQSDQNGVRTPLPQYEALSAEKTHGFKNRLLAGIKAFGAAGRDGAEPGELIGAALSGAVNPERVHQREFIEGQLIPAVRRRALEQQQDRQRRDDVDDRMSLLIKAAQAERYLRDPQDVYRPINGGQYAMIYNPRTGQMEIAKDSNGQPIEAASVVNGRTQAQSRENVANANNQTREEIAAANNASRASIANGNNQYRWKVEQYKQRQMNNRSAASIGAANNRAAAGIASRTLDPAAYEPSQAEVQAAVQNQLYPGLTVEAIRARLREEKRAALSKNALPNGQAGLERLGGWNIPGGRRQ